MLIAANGTLRIDGQLSAYGGGGGSCGFSCGGGGSGSGGAIRLVADVISGIPPTAATTKPFIHFLRFIETSYLHSLSPLRERGAGKVATFSPAARESRR